MDDRTGESNPQTLALLKILALGEREIEQGKFRSAQDVFAEMGDDARGKWSSSVDQA